MISNKYNKRLCPSCSKDDTIINSKISSPEPSEKLNLLSNKNSWVSIFPKKSKSFFSYFRCNNCKMLYAPEHFTKKQLNNFYKKLVPNMDQVPKKLLQETQYEYFKLLRKWSSLEGNYLEVGPDIGLFTHYCVQKGNFNHYWLFEPNNLVTPKLKSLLKNKNFTISPIIEKIDKVNKDLSTVIIIHVLDHLLEPKKILTKLRAKMKPGGLILIVTHDESSIMRKILGWRWPAFCLQHPQLFNYKTTEFILNESGFNVLEQSKSKNYFEISFLIKNLLWVFGIKIQKLPKWLNFSVGLKLGNIITIASVV